MWRTHYQRSRDVFDASPYDTEVYENENDSNKKISEKELANGEKDRGIFNLFIATITCQICIKNKLKDGNKGMKGGEKGISISRNNSELKPAIKIDINKMDQ